MAAKSNLKNMALCLSLVCLICSAVLALVYAVTAEPIKAAEQKALVDSISQVLTIYNTSWIISMFSDATSADMDIEEVTSNTIRASWINHFSEPVPFFERFFLRRIE